MESWKVSDELWEQVEPHIPKPQRDPDREYRRKIGGGRKPTDSRKIFEAIIYVLRTGIQWKSLPEKYGAGSTVHRFFHVWEKAGFFHDLWMAGLQLYDEFKGIKWEWQSIDGSQRKSPMGLESVGPNPTDRGKNGTKTHVLTDGAGVPLSLVVTGANRHDATQLEQVLDDRVVNITEDVFEHLCADVGRNHNRARIYSTRVLTWRREKGACGQPGQESQAMGC